MYLDGFIILQGPVVRKVDTAIHRIVIFSNFLKLFTHYSVSLIKDLKIKFSIFELKVSFH